MIEILKVMGSQLAFVCVIFFLLQWLTGGFIGKFIKVKASRGKNVLVEVFGIYRTYWAVGEIIDDMLSFTPYGSKKKDKLSVKIEEKAKVYQKMGVPVLYYDEIKQSLLSPDFTGTPIMDLKTHDNLLKRAIMAPKYQDKLMKLIAIGLLLCLGAAFISAFLSYKNNTEILLLKNSVLALTELVKTIPKVI